MSSFGNPYTDIQIDHGFVQKDVQALAYAYFPVDIAGQRGNSRRLDLIEAAWHAYADLVVLTGDLP